MNILVVLPRFPYPLEKGDKLRAYHQLRILSQKHTLYLVALHEGQLKAENVAQVSQFCKEIHVVQLTIWSKFCNIICSFLKGLPLQCGYFYKKEAQNTIQ